MENIKIVNQLNESKEKLFNMISRVIIGQRDVIDHLFIALLCKGHILLEGVRGAATRPGQLRDRQVWIGVEGTPIEEA